MNKLLEIKKKLIEEVLENATDEQIDQLFEKCSEILVGKSFSYNIIYPSIPITPTYPVVPLYIPPEIINPTYRDTITLDNTGMKISS